MAQPSVGCQVECDHTRGPGPGVRVRGSGSIKSQSSMLAFVLRVSIAKASLPGGSMPEEATVKRARKAKRAGKSPTTQAGEFVREEIHHVREGKHGARSAKQAIAIGLSKARRAGVKLPAPPASASRRTKQSAASASRAGRRGGPRKTSAKRSRATKRALKRESRSTASRQALSKQARTAARSRQRRRRQAA